MTSLRRRVMSHCADALYTAIPRPLPGTDRLAAARIIAHRGSTGVPGAALENTMAAFERCRELRLFGIELDVQWTRDGVPVVFHDPDTTRLFGAPGKVIADTAFETLRERYADIPALEKVIERFASHLHLMIEIKAETFESRHVTELRRVVSTMDAENDYHLLCLDPSILASLPGFEPGVKLAVAETNTREIVAAVHRLGLTRIAGHYALFSRRLRRDLEACGIRYGVGMVPSVNILRRELSLGSHWVFTNHAARLAAGLENMRRARA
jgi:glycerophosphoryl diester phosphodiesterase